jgi:hypothetical protein
MQAGDHGPAGRLARPLWPSGMVQVRDLTYHLSRDKQIALHLNRTLEAGDGQRS